MANTTDLNPWIQALSKWISIYLGPAELQIHPIPKGDRLQIRIAGVYEDYKAAYVISYEELANTQLTPEEFSKHIASKLLESLITWRTKTYTT